MKLKAQKQFSMRDQLVKAQVEDANTQSEREVDIEISDFDAEKNELYKQYNESILKLDTLYTDIKPIRKIIVRAFVQEAEEDTNGVLRSPSLFVKKVTDSGYGYAGVIENPFPYSRKAVVVAVPENLKLSLSPGEVVVLEEDQVQCFARGKGDNAETIVKNAFVRSDVYKELSIPQNPTNQHFGYLKIDYSAIDFKL
jgi:hypothetical protein